MSIPDATSFTPREIVSELDRYIVGQDDAKRAVAIALRNRWRRQQLDDNMREEVLPKNILMIGPTGVGKTEIARRLANLAQAPFIKVEATKFTEIGYVGRDVEQIIRDLVEIAVHLVNERMRKQMTAKAELLAEERVLDALVGDSAGKDTREKFRKKLRAGDLNDKEIEIPIADSGSGAMGMPTIDIPGMPGAQMGMLNLGEMMGKASGTDLAGFDAQLASTKMFYTPAEAVAFTTSEQLKTTMKYVAEFSFDHGLLGEGAADASFIGIETPVGVFGNQGNIKLRFDPSFMKMAADGKL